MLCGGGDIIERKKWKMEGARRRRRHRRRHRRRRHRRRCLYRRTRMKLRVKNGSSFVVRYTFRYIFLIKP